MAIVTVRPETRVGGSPAATLTGATDAALALRDNSDSTYLSGRTDGLTAYDHFSMPTPVQPANSKIRRIRINLRAYQGSKDANKEIAGHMILSPYSSQSEYALGEVWTAAKMTYAAWQTYYGPWQSKTYQGNLITAQMLVDMWVSHYIKGSYFHAAEIYVDVDFNVRPSATATGPSGSVTGTSSPLGTWNYSDPENDAQGHARVKVFTQTQFQAAGFDPETSEAFWDSGKVPQSTNTMKLPALTNGVYRMYVRVWQVDLDGSVVDHFSAWSFTEWTQDAPTPAVPLVADFSEPTDGRIRLDVRGRDNLLTANQASLETDTTGWVAGPNTTIVRTTAQASHGVASLQLTSVAAGNISARTPSGAAGFLVAPDTDYGIQAEFRSAAVSRSVRVEGTWYDAAGAAILSFYAGGDAVSTTTTGWSRYTRTERSPANAAYLEIVPVVLATGGANEVHYVEKIGVQPHGITAWSPGGYTGNTFVVEYSDDGGVTWTVHPRMGGAHSGSALQFLATYDYETKSGQVRQYRVRSSTGGTPLYQSEPSAVVSESMLLSGWWVHVVADPSQTARMVRQFTWHDREHDQRVAVKETLGRTNRVVLTGGYAGAEFPIVVTVESEADYRTMRSILRSAETLLVRTPHGRSWYVETVSRVREVEFLKQPGVHSLHTDVIEVDAV